MSIARVSAMKFRGQQNSMRSFLWQYIATSVKYRRGVSSVSAYKAYKKQEVESDQPEGLTYQSLGLRYSATLGFVVQSFQDKEQA